MNNKFSLEPISKTGSLDSNLILRQCKLDFMARFMENKYKNPKLKQDQIATELGMSSSTLQLFRQEMIMFSPYRIPPGSHKRRQKILNTNLDDNSNREHDLKGPQMTSNELN